MTGSAKHDVSRADAHDKVHRRKVSAPVEPGLDRMIQAQIGDKLRAMYGELVEQPVPDRFTAILAQLGSQRRGS